MQTKEIKQVDFKGIGKLVEKLVDNPNLYFEIQNLIECVNMNFENRSDENKEQLQKILHEQTSGFLKMEYQKTYKEITDEK